MLRPRRWSLRRRLTLLLALTSLPFLIVANGIAWHSYRMVSASALDSAAAMRATAASRHEAAINGARQLLNGLGAVAATLAPELTRDPARCRMLLAAALDSDRQRYSNLALFGTDGRLICSARPLPASVDTDMVAARNQMLLASAAAHHFAVGKLRQGLFDSGQVLPVAIAAAGGFLYTALRIDWFAGDLLHMDGENPDALWLSDGAGPLLPIGAAEGKATPDRAVLGTLLGADTAVIAPGRDGIARAYASAGLGDGYRLIVATLAAHGEAWRILAAEIAGLALLLGVAIGIVAYGAQRSIVAPTLALSRAVRLWRDTGRFDPGALRDAPPELRDLGHAFGLAVRAMQDQARALARAREAEGLLLKETHHRVKNNLQIVASLLNLQASRIRSPEARAEFAAARDRVRALATLHRHLYAEGDIDTIEMKPFLEELAVQLLDAMAIDRERIRLEVSAEAVTLPTDQAVPLALIVTETVSNALKYAFPAQRMGRVCVGLAREGETVVLQVRDDGVGIQAGEQSQDHRPGIGRDLIRGFARQLGGKLSVSEEGGTAYEVRFAPMAEKARHPASVSARYEADSTNLSQETFP